MSPLSARPQASRSQSGETNEGGGLLQLLRYGLQPHRVGLLIYWQAVLLVWKGVPLHSPPTEGFKAVVQSRHGQPGRFIWHEPRSWLWNYS